MTRQELLTAAAKKLGRVVPARTLIYLKEKGVLPPADMQSNRFIYTRDHLKVVLDHCERNSRRTARAK